MRSLLIIVLLTAVVLALVLAMRRSGPRVTEIETRREEVDEDRDA